MDNELITKADVKALIRSGVATETYADQDYVCALIDDLLPVDAAQVIHGRWITNDDCGELECPICGGVQIEHGMFCTWCGAKCDGGVQDDD